MKNNYKIEITVYMPIVDEINDKLIPPEVDHPIIKKIKMKKEQSFTTQLNSRNKANGDVNASKASLDSRKREKNIQQSDRIVTSINGNNVKVLSYQPLFHSINGKRKVEDSKRFVEKKDNAKDLICSKTKVEDSFEVKMALPLKQIANENNSEESEVKMRFSKSYNIGSLKKNGLNIRKNLLHDRIVRKVKESLENEKKERTADERNLSKIRDVELRESKDVSTLNRMQNSKYPKSDCYKTYRQLLAKRNVLEKDLKSLRLRMNEERLKSIRKDAKMNKFQSCKHGNSFNFNIKSDKKRNRRNTTILSEFCTHVEPYKKSVNRNSWSGPNQSLSSECHKALLQLLKPK